MKHEKNGEAETFTLSAGVSSTNAPMPNFALNWVPGIPAKAKMPPSKYAAALADEAAKNHRIEDRTAEKKDGFDTISFRYTEALPGRPESVLRYQFLANDRTGSLFIAAFEAPAKDWENAWKQGRVIAESLRLDPAR